MSDERLRDLERRFRETKAREDEVAWLNERRCAGLVDERVLQAVAAMGHAAAVEITGIKPIERYLPQPPWWTLGRWRDRRRVIDITGSLVELRKLHGVFLPGSDQMAARTALVISLHRGELPDVDHLGRVVTVVATPLSDPGSRGPLPAFGPRVSKTVRKLSSVFGRILEHRAAIMHRLAEKDTQAALSCATQLEAARRDLLGVLQQHVGDPDADEASALMATVRADLGAWLLEHRPEAESPGAGDRPFTPCPHGP